MALIKKILLSPFAVLYGIITGVRNRFYDWGILKSTEFDRHTICVGNLAVGGTGKTPHVEYLIRLLQPDFKVATLSRGYKRKSNGFLLATANSTAHDIGDEPLQYKTKYPSVTVSVDADRVHGVQELLEHNPSPHVILLDDAFQHRAIRCGLNIVISEYSNPYLQDHMLPMGQLREPKGGIRRADVIIISKTPERASAIDLRNMLRDLNPLPHQRLFFSYLRYGHLRAWDNRANTIDTLEELYRYKLLVFTGIGNPAPMLTWLKEYAADIEHLRFSDHHDYTLNDIEDVRRKWESLQGHQTAIVTTEKDAMRLLRKELADICKQLPLYVLPIEVDFRDKTQEFNETIFTYVRSNRIHHEKYS